MVKSAGGQRLISLPGVANAESRDEKRGEQVGEQDSHVLMALGVGRC